MTTPVGGSHNDDVMPGVESALRAVAGLTVVSDAPLADVSTYRLGGPASLLVEAATLHQLGGVRDALADRDVPVLLVGRGSNLLVADAGFPGLALRLTGEFEVVAVDEKTVAAGGGVALPVLARRAAGQGKAGLEFYVGIPGSVGGAVRMNAGGHGRETSGVLLHADVFDLTPSGSGEPERRSAASLGLAYRTSSLGSTDVVIGATYAVEADDPAACAARIDDIVRWRREHQPGGSNAGSVFTNPVDDSAGRIIDACGLKGHRVGGVVVSEKHANFFQADEGATAADVYQLVVDVRRVVQDRTGVRLVPELTLVGFDPLA